MIKLCKNLLQFIGAMTVLFLLAVVFWQPKATGQDYFDEYNRVLGSLEEQPLVLDQNIARFEAMFTDLSSHNVAIIAEQLYADRVYFNDTLTTIHGKADLVAHLASLPDYVSSGSTRIIGVQKQGSHYYVHWRLQFESNVMGIHLNSDSHGVSHLVLDDNDQIVVHQDFWDSKAGVFENVPVFKQLFALAN